jgi:hypothetical protein
MAWIPRVTVPTRTNCTGIPAVERYVFRRVASTGDRRTSLLPERFQQAGLSVQIDRTPESFQDDRNVDGRALRHGRNG